MRIHRSAALVGVTCLLGASLAVGAVLGTPAVAGVTADAATTATGTTTVTTPTGPPATSTATGSTAGSSSSTWPTFNGTDHDIPSSDAGSTPPPCTPPPMPTRWSAGDVIYSTGFEGIGSSIFWPAEGSGVTITETQEVATQGSWSLRADGLGAGDTMDTGTFEVSHLGWYKVTAKLRVKLPATAAWIRLSRSSGSGVAGISRATADGWTQVTAFVHADTTRQAPYCNGATRTLPDLFQLRLAVVQAPCGTSADGPMSLYVDDLTITTADGSTDGTPSPSLTPVTTVPPPLGCPSPPTSPTTPPPATCLPGYSVVSTWPGGYLAAVTARNLGTATLPDWSLSWTFPDDQVVTSLWGARSWTQTGRTVTAVGPDWAPLTPGGTVTVGFVGTAPRPGNPALPRQLAVRSGGRVCGALG